MINISRADEHAHDAHYRYKMPALVTKHQGGNTHLCNAAGVAAALKRDTLCLTKYLARRVGTQAKLDTRGGSADHVLQGLHDTPSVQEEIHGFASKFVLCPRCGDCGTTLEASSGTSKKQARLVMDCGACGRRGATSHTGKDDRVVQQIIKTLHAQQKQQKKSRGKGRAGAGTGGEAVAAAPLSAKQQRHQDRAARRKARAAMPSAPAKAKAKAGDDGDSDAFSDADFSPEALQLRATALGASAFDPAAAPSDMASADDGGHVHGPEDEDEDEDICFVPAVPGAAATKEDQELEDLINSL